jgi:hypothetical protein
MYGVTVCRNSRLTRRCSSFLILSSRREWAVDNASSGRCDCITGPCRIAGLSVASSDVTGFRLRSRDVSSFIPCGLSKSVVSSLISSTPIGLRPNEYSMALRRLGVMLGIREPSPTNLYGFTWYSFTCHAFAPFDIRTSKNPARSFPTDMLQPCGFLSYSLDISRRSRLESSNCLTPNRLG